MSWAYKFPASVKLLAWNSFIRSKIMYGAYCILNHNQRILPMIKQFFYSSLKHMLGIKSRPKTD